MDFVTFGEEWFVRPPRRDVRPDNRVECQSFTKSRYFNRLFYPDRPDLPPAKCGQFWAWNNRFDTIEVVFTGPSDALISSFGHLSILLRTQSTDGPGEEDAVFQYVGLIPMGGNERPSFAALTSEVPLVLQVESYADFEKQNRRYEDRRIYRFSTQLSRSQQIWLKARLWEQVRRTRLTYQFLNQNCAEMVLRLFDATSSAPLSANQSGVTVSPLGVISLLHASGWISGNPVLVLQRVKRLMP